MEDLEVSDFDGGLVGIGDAAASAAADDGCFGSSPASAADFDPQMISSLLASDPRLETEKMEDIEEVLGSGMSNFPMLHFGMDLTDDDELDDLDAALTGNGDDNTNSRKKQKQKQQRGGRKRLSVFQVYSLEKSFKIDSKLVPHRKQHLAKELELKPRQVAIWFQNRRARYKNKQFEKDYDKIAGQYGVIKAEFDKVVNENKKLKVEMKKMKQEMNLMKDNLAKYRKLMRARRLMGSQMMLKMRAETDQLMQGSGHEQPQTDHQLILQNNNNNNNPMNLDGGVCNNNGGVMIEVAPPVQVQPHHQHQQVNSPASVTSVFDSNSTVFAPQQLLQPPVAAELEPAEKTNNSFMQQQGDEHNNVSMEFSNNNHLSNNMFDLDERNFFAAEGPAATGPYSFGAFPADDEAFWQFQF